MVIFKLKYKILKPLFSISPCIFAIFGKTNKMENKKIITFSLIGLGGAALIYFIVNLNKQKRKARQKREQQQINSQNINNVDGLLLELMSNCESILDETTDAVGLSKEVAIKRNQEKCKEGIYETINKDESILASLSKSEFEIIRNHYNKLMKEGEFYDMSVQEEIDLRRINEKYPDLALS
jgi:hypothetical protein